MTEMMKKIMFLIVSLLLVSCVYTANDTKAKQKDIAAPIKSEEQAGVHEVGTILFNDLEGGFWGFLGDSGVRYEPMNLPNEFKVQGVKVRIMGRRLEDVGSLHMWGDILEIQSIERLTD